MSTKNLTIIFISLGALWYLLPERQETEAPVQAQVVEKKLDGASARRSSRIRVMPMARAKSLPVPKKNIQPVLKEDRIERNRIEKQSVSELLKTLNVFNEPVSSIEEFMQRVKAISGQDHEDPLDPFEKKQGSKEDGYLHIIRTAGALPHTKNFHAQFFSDANEENLRAQHISFDIEPSEGAFNRAVQIVHEMFPDLGEPVENRTGFVKWRSSDGHYIVWINHVDEENLKDLYNDPFSAYSQEDLGLVQVAIEEEIH